MPTIRPPGPITLQAFRDAMATAASPSTVLIVGGSGFLGVELVRQASAAGHRVAATDQAVQ